MAYNNGNKFDKNAHYDAKTTKQLETLIAHWKDSVVKYPQCKVINEELGIVQMKLAERIGKK